MIIISIGHSGGQVGAVAHNTTEYNECEKIGKKVVENLLESKVDVKLADTTLDLSKRITSINSYSTINDILIELHMDSASPQAEGATMFYYAGDEKSKDMAESFIDVYTKETGIKKRKSLGDTQNRHGRLGIIRDTKPRAFLIELGFISNEKDLAIVREKSVDALCNSILAMIGIVPEENNPKNAVASWAEASFIKAEKKGFSRDNPTDPVDQVRLRKILVKAGYQIQDNNNPVTYQEMIVVLDREGKFNS